MIGCAVEIHRTLGPGLPESVYDACLRSELQRASIAHLRPQILPVMQKGEELVCERRIDVIVEQVLVPEIKVQQILPLHKAQLLTDLRVSGLTMAC